MDRDQLAKPFPCLVHLLILDQASDFNREPCVFCQVPRSWAGPVSRRGQRCRRAVGVDAVLASTWQITTHTGLRCVQAGVYKFTVFTSAVDSARTQGYDARFPRMLLERH